MNELINPEIKWLQGTGQRENRGVIANRFKVCIWHVLVLVAITKYYRMGGLHNRNLWGQQLSSLCHYLASSLYMHGAISGTPSFVMTTLVSDYPHTFDFIKLYLPKIPFPNTVTLALGLQHIHLGGRHNLVHSMEWWQCSRIDSGSGVINSIWIY